MRTRRLGTLVAGLVAALPLAAVAERPLHAPHDQTFATGTCDNCHTLFVRSPGGKADFTPGCVKCHNELPSSSHGFPWLPSDQGAPGQGGNQHSWSGLAVNPAAGARTPTSSDVASRLVDGKLQCTVCHDAHDSGAAFAPSSLNTSIPVGVAKAAFGAPTGTAKLTLLTPGTAAKAYRVKLRTVAAGGGTFILSHDIGLQTPTWFNWDGGAWVAGTDTGAGMPYTNDTPVALDDPAVTVQLTAGGAAGDYWDFVVSYPFLRQSNVADVFCYQCHAERVMNHARASGTDASYAPNGVRKFSHAVGVALDPAVILDANGAVQTAGDTRPGNDLKLDSGLVRCTTCHSVHNAPSNSLAAPVAP